MSYNIEKLCEDFRLKYDTSNFNYMKSFKDLVVFFLSYILDDKALNILLRKEVLLTKEQYRKLNKCIYKAIVKNVPIEYIVGFTYIYGDKYLVNKHVLIPRQDTETLIEIGIEEINKNNYTTLLDICTGSGVVGISLSKHTSLSNITVSDISRKAINVAIQNAAINEINEISVIKSNLFSNIEKGLKYDIITANPPYITKQEMKKLDKNVLHEPHIALYGGYDGLDFYRKIACEASDYLTNNGALLIEIGESQAKDVKDILQATGKYIDIKVYKDINNKDRVILCHFQKK